MIYPDSRASGLRRTSTRLRIVLYNLVQRADVPLRFLLFVVVVIILYPDHHLACGVTSRLRIRPRIANRAVAVASALGRDRRVGRNRGRYR